MNSIFLYTKTGIAYKDAIETIRKTFSNKKKVRFDGILKDDYYEADFSYGSTFDMFWIRFTPNNSMLDDEILLTKEELALIPFVGYWTCIDYWNEENAKKVVECLLPLYPEMYVDNDYGSIVPASEYLKAPIIIEKRPDHYYD